MSENTASIQQLVADAAKSFRKSLHLVGYLNGRQDAVMPERNTVVHLASALVRAGFATYAEPDHSDRSLVMAKQRIDLLAARDGLSLVIEVKAFGGLKLREVLEDAKRLEAFVPQAGSPCGDGAKLRNDDSDPLAFWKSGERWAVLVIQSMMGEQFSKL